MEKRADRQAGTQRRQTDRQSDRQIQTTARQTDRMRETDCRQTGVSELWSYCSFMLTFGRTLA